MHINDYIKLKKKLFDKANKLSISKGLDYSGKSNTLVNLELVERMGIASTQIGILVRLIDKIARLRRFTESNVFAVKDEKLEDTVIDAINYLTLLYASVVEKKHDGTSRRTSNRVRKHKR